MTVYPLLQNPIARSHYPYPVCLFCRWNGTILPLRVTIPAWISLYMYSFQQLGKANQNGTS